MKQNYFLLFVVSSVFAQAQTANHSNFSNVEASSGMKANTQTFDFAKSPNSYIYDLDVAKTNNYGGLEIPVKKAYEMWAKYDYLKNNGQFTPIPQGNLSATLYWEDLAGLVESVAVNAGSSPEDSTIKVNINKGKGKGNAVIAFKVNGVIYWSWHIWVTDNPENGVSYKQGFETDKNGNPIEVQYMDRNLGASTDSFLGNQWQKSGGLLYEWGRKDPFPALANKDFFFYELDGEVGNLKHRTIDSDKTIPLKIREFNEIEKNMNFAVKNPLTLIINTDNANWFSNKLHRSEGPGTDFMAWDLWSDNFKGGNGNANSSNTQIKNDTRSYELKSELDPCPDGWRVPSYYGRVTTNNNMGPWGRKNSGGNDDTNGYNLIKPDMLNAALDGVKVYPGLGIDFSKAQNGGRNLGLVPITGGYKYYPNSVAPNTSIYSIYQDENSNGGLWSGTYGFDGPRYLGVISDAERKDVSAAGLNSVYVNQTGLSKDAMAVRCMRDPNIDFIGHFPTQYFADTEESYANGLDAPNTYMVIAQPVLEIPISKAFAVYNQVLTNQDNLPTNHLVAKILWTDNKDLVKDISLNLGSGDVRDGKIIINLDPNQVGNAVVSLHNNSTETPAYWSWQIWSPGEQPGTITYTTEDPTPAAYNFVNLTKSNLAAMTTNFMDRNLGARLAAKNNSNFTPNDISVLSSGLHYQWGRKDAMPLFRNLSNAGTSAMVYLGAENTSETGILNYSNISGDDYERNYSKEYSLYASNNSNETKKISENILYSVNNPMQFLYRSGAGQLYDGGIKSNNDVSQIRDWVSDKQSKAPERWGHADKKSVFDPCPDGWRVPDVSYTALYTSSKGNSPFYNGSKKDRYGKDGLIQDQATGISDYYEGENVQNYYVKFESGNYNVGNFPFAGIRGEFGGNKVSVERSGVWLASLADLGTGYGLAMEFDQNSMQAGTGAYPQAAMSVRCAKDEPRFLLINPVKTSNSTLSTINIPPANTDVSKDIYPNPFRDKIYLKKELKAQFEIYDISGKVVRTGKVKNTEIDAVDLLPGTYILKITDSEGKIITKKMIKTK
ncbi:T9SS type A sorting domain-containing protein [Halpernia frigidisoli]|uniref:Por secretion system C-terminal sorting domain-containing protein n=1 Tax=Halpernia frigidisoli TaxID=1125876 RepID=A0A1I3I6H8_9FLAO|nr:T9SS type A sorting domain-containing protein [Halpernia frigidisoli]SFI43614.1 Por secretion system C-terminal sorting domain-containing protein [Halpernia frigidisoli]